jgi:serine/threonine protein kinase
MSEHVPTERARGTSGYRAPELLHYNDAHFSFRTDMWALGCLLFQVLTRQRIFREDFYALQYSNGRSDLPLPIPFQESEFWQHHISELIHDLLDVNPDARPSADDTHNLISSYCTLFEVGPSSLDIFMSEIFPSYSDCKNFFASVLSEPARMFEIAKWYTITGNTGFSESLVKDLISREEDRARRTALGPQRLQSTFEDHTFWLDIPQFFVSNRQYSQAAFVYSSLLKRDPTNLELRKGLARAYALNKQYNEAVIIENGRLAGELWELKELCQKHLLDGDLDTAIQICRNRIRDFPNDVSASLFMSHLQVIGGKYSDAIKTQMDALATCGQVTWMKLFSIDDSSYSEGENEMLKG